MKNENLKAESDEWLEQFASLYTTATQRFANGIRGADRLFSEEDVKFMNSIGATPQEIYDFIEDWIDAGEPDPDTVIRITAVRRDYFFTEQQGQPSSQKISMNSLPSMGAALGGYRWLPRIIMKAQAKLRGEMPPELMYGCGGDRPFLRKLRIDPAEFLTVVWESKGQERHILEFVNQKSSGSSSS